MAAGLSAGEDGLRCAEGSWRWAELAYEIISDGEGGLLFNFCCPSCGRVLHSDPFAYPPDAPQRSERAALEG